MLAKNPIIGLCQQASFLISAAKVDQCPEDSGLEVAFAGRSNAGKSSALNAICQRNGLARTSKTPGRTQQLVYFQVRPQHYLVDLPGYGYAEVPLHLREHWKAFIEGYFQSRKALTGLVVVMDSRHPLKDYDRQMVDFAFRRNLNCHVLLTKADKLSRSAQAQTLAKVRKELGGVASAQLFSSPDKLGVEEARAVVSGWLGLAKAE